MRWKNLASELLPVRDALEAALAADNSTLEAMRQGVELTLKQINSVFDKAAIREVHPIGEKFDPHRHQAMTTILRQGAQHRGARAAEGLPAA